jgi:hypothetical protein
MTSVRLRSGYGKPALGEAPGEADRKSVAGYKHPYFLPGEDAFRISAREYQ